MLSRCRLRPAFVTLRTVVRGFATEPSGPYPPSCTASVPLINAHLVLYTGRPVVTWPSHFHAVSPLNAALNSLTADGAALAKYTVCVSDAGIRRDRTPDWDPTTAKSAKPVSHGQLEEEYDAVLQTRVASHPVPFPVSLSNLPALCDFIESLNRQKRLPPPITSLPQAFLAIPREQEALASTGQRSIYICTHGTRDCRCADRGEPLFQAVLREIELQGLGGRIKVERVGHVGGHKFAATAIVYPTGNWFGLLTEDDAKRLVNTVARDEVWWTKWRGRTGVEKEVQQGLFDRAMAASSRQERKLPERRLGRATIARFKTFTGETLTFGDARVGEDLKTVAKRHNAPSIEATCGGFCECATCQVYVGDAPLPSPTVEEDDMLFTAVNAQDDSRLSCQLVITEDLARWFERGGSIRLPRY